MRDPVVASIGNERALSVLRHAYTKRLDLARDAHAGGARLIGLIGNTIPGELILASGAHPVLVTADLSRRTPHADVFMEAIIPPETRALFESAASGELAFLELLVLSRPYAHLYYYLKEAYRLGHGTRFPSVTMFDLMHSRREAVRAYNWGRLQALIARLERVTGQEITESRLREAIGLTNTLRALQRRLLELRWQGAVSGVDALTAIGAAYFMQPDAYLSALGEYVAQIPPEPAQKPRLVVVTSEPLSHTRLHQAIESAGAIVVGEDDWWGSRAPGGDVPFAGSAREAIFQKYWLDTPSAGVYPATARETWLREHALKPDVDGVVFYLPPSDHQLGWDYPRLRDWLADHRKPSLLLREDATQPESGHTIGERTRVFVESLQ